MRLYHEMLKGLKAIIEIQRQVKEIIKIAGEINIMIKKMKETVLNTSINEQIINVINIIRVLEDL